MLLLLQLNNIVINYTQEEIVKLGLGIADGTMEVDEIKDWINNHKK